MASRMDRYSKEEVIIAGRSTRNKSLYKKIEDMDSYSNIAGIAKLEDKNFIDLEKVKELLKHGDEIKEETPLNEKPQEVKLEEEIKNYDINDLLSKIKDNKNIEEKKYRSLSEKQHELLKELNEKHKNSELDDVELEELVETISEMDPLNVDGDDVGLLDDLKSDTMVGDATSIKQIIEEEKEFTREFDTQKLDKSFYTSSFGFTQRDFEELKDMNHKIKKDNKKIIVLLITLIILIVGIICFTLLK